MSTKQDAFLLSCAVWVTNFILKSTQWTRCYKEDAKCFLSKKHILHSNRWTKFTFLELYIFIYTHTYTHTYICIYSSKSCTRTRWRVLFLFDLFFYWSIIVFQCCISFHCTIKWISSMYTYIPSILDLPPTFPPSHLSRSSQSTELSTLWYPAAFH